MTQDTSTTAGPASTTAGPASTSRTSENDSSSGRGRRRKATPAAPSTQEPADDASVDQLLAGILEDPHSAGPAGDRSHLLARVPRYALIADEIRQRITSGELGPGDPILSETQMMDTYDVSRLTARRAVQELRTLGLVVTEHGKPSRVRGHAPGPVTLDISRPADASPWPLWLDPDRWQGETRRYRSIAAQLAAALNCAPDTPTLIHTTTLTDPATGLRLRHEVVAPFTTLHAHPALTKPVALPELRAALNNLRGAHGPFTWTDTIHTDTDAITTAEPGAPVLIHTRTTTSPAHLALITTAPADEVRYAAST